MAHEGDFAFDVEDREAWTKLLGGLCDLSSMQWSSLEVDRKRFHRWGLDQIPKRSQRAVQDAGVDDPDPPLCQFRLGSTERVIGLIEGDDVWLLLWDPNHKFYPTKKKGEKRKR